MTSPLNIRQKIAERLTKEMTRKGISKDQIISGSRLSPDIIDAYFAGGREIDFSELKKICGVLFLDVMWLIGGNYQTSHLQYRQSKSKDREIASKIENTFLIVKDSLPDVKRIAAPKIDCTQNDTAWLLSHVKKSVETVQMQFSTVEEIIAAANIPVLDIHAGEESFDAFFMTSGKKAVICVNLDKPTIRIHFSLLHEVAHFLFDTDKEVPVDVFASGLYYDTISPESMPEYIANKFAQFFLVPFDDALNFSKNWQNLTGIEDYINCKRTGTDVLVNAIHDVLRMGSTPPRYASVKDAVNAAAPGQWGGDRTLREFLRECGTLLRKKLVASKGEYSDEVWNSIKEVWEIQ